MGLPCSQLLLPATGEEGTDLHDYQSNSVMYMGTYSMAGLKTTGCHLKNKVVGTMTNGDTVCTAEYSHKVSNTQPDNTPSMNIDSMNNISC